MIAVKATIRIEGAIDDVFAYVADPDRFPDWNSAVTNVQPTSATTDNPPTFVMTRHLPTGMATNEFQVVAFEPPTRFGIETTSGPTPFRHEYRFSEEDHATTIELDAQADIGLAPILGPFARRGLESGIRANLETLKNILEAARS